MSDTTRRGWFGQMAAALVGAGVAKAVPSAPNIPTIPTVVQPDVTLTMTPLYRGAISSMVVQEFYYVATSNGYIDEMSRFAGRRNMELPKKG